jgi:hypothetical protein
MGETILNIALRLAISKQDGEINRHLIFARFAISPAKAQVSATKDFALGIVIKFGNARLVNSRLSVAREYLIVIAENGIDKRDLGKNRNPIPILPLRSHFKKGWPLRELLSKHTPLFVVFVFRIFLLITAASPFSLTGITGIVALRLLSGMIGII